MAFLISLGVIQLASARASLTGLWLMTGRRAVRRVGWLLIAAGVLIYFLLPMWQTGPWASAADPTASQAWHTAPAGDLTAAHNISDTQGSLSGNTQARLLLTSAAAASLVSALFGAWTVRRRRDPKPAKTAIGMEVLEGDNLLAAIRSARSGRTHRDSAPVGGSPARAGPGRPR